MSKNNYGLICLLGMVLLGCAQQPATSGNQPEEELKPGLSVFVNPDLCRDDRVSITFKNSGNRDYLLSVSPWSMRFYDNGRLLTRERTSDTSDEGRPSFRHLLMVWSESTITLMYRAPRPFSAGKNLRVEYVYYEDSIRPEMLTRAREFGVQIPKHVDQNPRM